MKRKARMTTSVLVSGFVASVSAAPLAASADDYDLYEQEMAESPSIEVGDIEDDAISSFIAASDAIKDIRDEYAGEIADDPEAYEELRADANEEMVNAVESEGIDVSEYRDIGYFVHEDEEFQAQVELKAATES